MTGQPFLTALLGDGALIAVEAAFGADLTDVDGSGWTWTDVTADVRHASAVNISLGRADNVSQAAAAQCGFALDNTDGDYTPLNPTGSHYPDVRQNTPIRHRISLDAGSTWATRFQGYATSFNPTWDTSAQVKQVVVTALGALGRIGGSKKPLRSALSRAITRTGAIAHWELSDGPDATMAASSISGGEPMRGRGTVAFGTVDGPPGAGTAADLTGGGILNGPVPVTVSDTWRVEFSAKWPTSSNVVAARVYSVGTIGRYEIAPSSGNLGLSFVFADGTVTQLTGAVTIADGKWHRVRLDVQQGSDIHAANMELTVAVDGTTYIIDEIVGGQIGPVSRIVLNPAGTASSAVPAISNVAAWSPWDTSLSRNTWTAENGYVGELASDRIVRLCGEEGIDLDLPGNSTVTMGPQRIDTLINLLRECETADHGILYDGIGPGIAYQCRTDRYNATAALALDMDTGDVAPPFEPKFDRQQVKNVYTVDRVDGSNATSERADGPLGTDVIGVEDAAVTLATDDDTTLADHAAWLTALGTVAGLRYPNLNLNLVATPTLAADLLPAAGSGFAISIANPASKAVDLPPDGIDLFVEGWAETISASSWDLKLNTSPYEPYRVGVLDTDRADSGSSTLYANVTSNATSLVVVTTETGDLWTTTSGSFPFDILSGGERMTVSAISNDVTPVDGTFETGVADWQSATGGTWAQQTTHVHTGSSGAVLTAATSPAQTYVRSTLPVSPGDSVSVTMWMYSVAALSGHAALSIDWLDSSDSYLSTSSTSVDLAAATWTKVTLTASAPTTAAVATIGPSLYSSPATGTALYCDDFAVLVAGRQVFTVTRSINGVVKAQTAGEPVHVHRPLRAAL